MTVDAELDMRRERVMITGAHGFLGSFVTNALEKAGCRELLSPTHKECDLLDFAGVQSYLTEQRPSVIFHLAARVGGIGANQQNPGRYFYENMQMGMNVLEAGRQTAIKKMVLVGTICSYPKYAPVPFREADLWNGYPEETNAPYGIAKKALVTMAQSYRQQYGLNTVCLLPVNLYGPRDNFDLQSSHVIPALVRKCVDALDQQQDHIELWGDGTPTREFLYVADCAEALVTAARCYNDPSPVNVGTGFEISIRDLAHLISKLTGFRGKILWDVSRPNGQPRRMLDTTLAKERFGFVAQTSLEAGLEHTVEWYQSNKEHIRRNEPDSNVCL
jgi:GDP-L-fucose synthase